MGYPIHAGCKICGTLPRPELRFTNFWTITEHNICEMCLGSKDFIESRKMARPTMDKILILLDELRLLSMAHDWTHSDPPLFFSISNMHGIFKRTEQLILETEDRTNKERKK